ncbi:AP2/ERF transcription factor ERF/PTI6 [Artemisia annua]|uniref:AP2/ERF transcription factor ERF/PTI6 n=1 Tax=Artemisia annua TaxID=35608 RepID=A0A2U1N0D4_ARTAN|nr:AP2/ERF transcription factor ERF/PTI6 [Artemisia annua]
MDCHSMSSPIKQTEHKQSLTMFVPTSTNHLSKTQNTPKVVRISVTDPYATDSSSDEDDVLFARRRVKKIRGHRALTNFIMPPVAQNPPVRVNVKRTSADDDLCDGPRNLLSPTSVLRYKSISESNGPSKDVVEGVKEGEECQSSNGSDKGLELEKNGLGHLSELNHSVESSVTRSREGPQLGDVSLLDNLFEYRDSNPVIVKKELLGPSEDMPLLDDLFNFKSPELDQHGDKASDYIIGDDLGTLDPFNFDDLCEIPFGDELNDSIFDAALPSFLEVDNYFEDIPDNFFGTEEFLK